MFLHFIFLYGILLLGSPAELIRFLSASKQTFTVYCYILGDIEENVLSFEIPYASSKGHTSLESCGPGGPVRGPIAPYWAL